MGDRKLPIHGQAPEPDQPTCSPAAYVSNEEASVVAAMRELKASADAVRRELGQTSSPDERAKLEARLADLRARFRELAVQREAAYRRKMVMLGHLPPEALWE